MVNKMLDFELIERLESEDYNFIFFDMQINFFEHSKFLLYSILKGEFDQKPTLNYSIFLFDLFMKLFRVKKCSEKNEEKVLFFAYTGNQMKNLLPIYEEITKIEKSCIVLKQSPIHNKLKKMFFRKNISIYNEVNITDINYKFLQKYSTFSSIKIAFKFLIWSHSNKKNISKNIRHLLKKSNCAKKETQIFNLIVSNFFYNIYLLSSFRNYLVKSNVKLIVLSNEFTMLGNLTIMLAKSLNIKTLYVPHSIITGHPVYKTIYSDKVVLQGQHDYDFLKNQSNAHVKKLIVTGRPLIEQKLIKYSKVIKNTDTKIICLATQPLPVNMLFVKDIIGEIRKMNLSNIKIIIKPHPSENTIDYEILKARNVEISKENDLYKILFISDLVITINSNVGAEAAFLGIPTLSYNPWQIHKPIYVEKKIIDEIVTKEDVAVKIYEMLFDKKAIDEYKKRAEKYTLYMNHKLDGKSTERIISVIKSLMLNNI